MFKIFTSFLLTIISICSVAFIYYEYKPTVAIPFVPEILRKQSNTLHIDPRCNSSYFTEKGKELFCK